MGDQSCAHLTREWLKDVAQFHYLLVTRDVHVIYLKSRDDIGDRYVFGLRLFITRAGTTSVLMI